MSNTFNISRFGKLLAYDGKKYLRNFGITLAIFCCLNLTPWLFTLVFNFSMPALVRLLVIYVAVGLASIMVPAKAFGDINLPRQGVSYAMLPVSNLEKYLSYVLFCLLTPVFVLLFSWAFDSLLTLLPFGGFDHYIKHFTYRGALQDFLSELGGGGVVDMDGDSTEELQDFLGIFGSAYDLSFILGMLFSSGFFMLGNLFFKTHKTGKTLGIMIGFSYMISTLTQAFLLARGIYPWMNENAMGVSVDYNSLSDLVSPTMVANNILNTVLILALYTGLFFKLKTQKY